MSEKYMEVATAHINWLNKRAKKAALLERRVEELEKELRHLHNIHTTLEDTHIKTKSMTEHNFYAMQKLEAENQRLKEFIGRSVT